MEAIIGLSLLGLTGWGAYKAVEGTARLVRHRRTDWHTQQIANSQQQTNINRQIQSHRRRSEQNRRLQLAILHLDQGPDPDFRRAATAARAARDVPVGFRQRQYQRLRPLLVQHYRRCQSRGAAVEILLESLTELVEALGMQEYEADYIRQEAERAQAQRPTGTQVNAVHDFQQRLTQAQQEHEQRVQAIRSLANVSEEVREQLQETEEQRYQSQLFGSRE